MSGPAERVLIGCGVVALVGLVVSGGLSGDGDSPLVIAGFVMVMGSLLVGIFAALLGDRSHPFGRPQKTGLQGPGFFALGLSAALAALAVVMLMRSLAPAACDNAGFSPQHPPNALPDQGRIHAGGFHALPPGRDCHWTDVVREADGGFATVVVEEKTIPDASDYALGILIILSPVILSMGWRTGAQLLSGRRTPLDAIDRA